MGSISYPSTDLRDQLARVGAEAVRTGLVIGSGGNLSAREPGADECWITGAGTWLDRLEHSEFARLGIPDGAARGNSPVPSTEWRLHTETYRRRPDVNAIVHLHPQTSVLLTALGYHIALVTSDHAFYLRDVTTIPFIAPGTEQLALAAAEAVAGGANALVLGHHGCSVLADSVELAHKRAVNLEEAARSTYAALVLTGGDPQRVPSVPTDFLADMPAGGGSI